MNQEEKVASSTAKTMAMVCIRNTFLERMHMGESPESVTGDYSDVFVTDGTGKIIPWNELSRLNDSEMKKLMKDIVNKLYTFLLRAEDPEFIKMIRAWAGAAQKWDTPEVDEKLGKTDLKAE